MLATIESHRQPKPIARGGRYGGGGAGERRGQTRDGRRKCSTDAGLPGDKGRRIRVGGKGKVGWRSSPHGGRLLVDPSSDRIEEVRGPEGENII